MYYKVKPKTDRLKKYLASVQPEVGRSKYGAKRTEYNGHVYASKREAAYAEELDWRVKAGELAAWERQVSFDLIVAGVKICRYVIDFCEIDTHGARIYTEIKGMETPEFKLKFKLFKALYPTLTVQVVR